jgi:hypothetical protein
MSYTLDFYNSGSFFSIGPTQEKVITVELEPGFWDIVVIAHYGPVSDDTTLAALDKKPQVEIRSGQANSVSFTMDADYYMTPRIDGESIVETMSVGDSAKTLSITMQTSTVFTGIDGWTDSFSYQVHRGDGGENRTDVGSGGSFAAGSETLSWEVDPAALGIGTFYYYMEITNNYTYAPSSTTGAATNSIYMGRVEVTDGTSYSVGDAGPGGGIVFHYDPDGFISGGILCHYLEVGSNLGPAEWGASGTAIPGARGTEIGTGYDNTQAILAVLAGLGETGKAAQIAAAHSEPGFPGFTDWFLPSRRELSRLYALLILSGSFHSRWSSTETDANGAEWIYRSNNNVYYGTDPKPNTLEFRPIRAF